DAACSIEMQRLPELYCGFERRCDQGPIRYPVACRPQAWAAGALYMMLGASLGLEIEGRRHVLRLRNPTLPRFLPELSIAGLTIGEGRLDLTLIRRRGGDVAVDVSRREGRISVVIEK